VGEASHLEGLLILRAVVGDLEHVQVVQLEVIDLDLDYLGQFPKVERNVVALYDLALGDDGVQQVDEGLGELLEILF
jgi:hypothetical protein